MFPLNTIIAWIINIIMNKKYDNNIIASRAYFLHPTVSSLTTGQTLQSESSQSTAAKRASGWTWHLWRILSLWASGEGKWADSSRHQTQTGRASRALSRLLGRRATLSTLEPAHHSQPLCGFTPFFLVYGAEAVLPIDIEFDVPRVVQYTEKQAKEAREDGVDLLEEAREQAFCQISALSAAAAMIPQPEDPSARVSRRRSRALADPKHQRHAQAVLSLGGTIHCQPGARKWGVLPHRRARA
jgi:hypothetical protein